MKYIDVLEFVKKAGADNDAMGAGLNLAIPGEGLVVGLPAHVAGALAGLVSGGASEDELNKMDKSPGLSYLPGVGGYRLTRRVLSTVKNKKPRTTVFSEAVGPLTSSAILASVGNMAGSGFGRNGRMIGSAIGGGLGLLSAALGAAIGQARGHRTPETRAKEDANESAVSNFMVPGVAGYRAARRSHDMHDDEARRTEKREKDEKAKEDAKKDDK